MLTIAPAIRHVVDEWSVDIITMSFGWKVGPTTASKDVRKALRYATDNDTLLFAAASNDARSNTREIAFPASYSDVFGIFSTDGSGRWSDFNPHRQRNKLYIATLGEEVQSAIPTSLHQGLMQRRSGTSTATPIAAAIAALVLQFARQRPFPKEKALMLKSREVMLEIFKEMGGRDYDFTWLTPWEVLRREKEWAIMKHFIEEAMGRVL